MKVVTLDRGLASTVVDTSPWLLPGAKTLSYAVNMAATREAVRRGAEDVLFVSTDGYALEGPTSTLLVRHGDVLDRKSTRLNSSHVAISYAVFCLKKKNT